MKKILLGLGVLAMLVLAVVIFKPGNANASVVGAVKINGQVVIGKTSQLQLEITNNSTSKEELRNVTVWVPTKWYISFPGHNLLIRTNRFGPWSTLIAKSGRSGRDGFDAIRYIATPGTKAIPVGGTEILPLAMRTPTNIKNYPHTETWYWSADNGKGQIQRGTVAVEVVK